MDIKYCYGCIHQRTPAEWGKCMRKYPGSSSCGGKEYKRRENFIKWDQANRTRRLKRMAKLQRTTGQTMSVQGPALICQNVG